MLLEIVLFFDKAVLKFGARIIIIVYLQSKGTDWLQQLGKYSAALSVHKLHYMSLIWEVNNNCKTTFDSTLTPVVSFAPSMAQWPLIAI